MKSMKLYIRMVTIIKSSFQCKTRSEEHGGVVIAQPRDITDSYAGILFTNW